MKNAITIFLFFLISFNLSAQDSPQKSRENIFISPVIETALYGYENINYGGGIAFGYGTGAAIGIRLVMFVDFDGGSALEFNCFIKYFVFGKETYSGLFINIMAGPVIFNRLDNFSFNTNKGTFSMGVGLGWRFLFGDRWFMEPMVRGGYPYIFSAGVSGGLRL